MFFIRNFGTSVKYPTRCLYGFITHAFNAIDEERLKIVGPDRLCAEWILKNGGSIKFTNNDLYTNYNELPEENTTLFIKKIDASYTGINGLGLTHLDGCTQIECIVFHKCDKLENKAINKLEFVKNSLRMLQISSIRSVKDSGLRSISKLIKLEKLICFNLPRVKNMEQVEKELKSALPQCDIMIPEREKLIKCT